MHTVVDTEVGKASVMFNEHTGLYNACEYAEGPYCPMVGGDGATVEDAVAKFVRNFKARNQLFAVKLMTVGKSKLAVIKAIQFDYDKTMPEAKRMVDSVPVVLRSSLDIYKADILVERYGRLGATAAIFDDAGNEVRC